MANEKDTIKGNGQIDK